MSISTKITRPLSPHITIYNAQFTSILSGLHRITGVILAMYGFILFLFIDFNLKFISYYVMYWIIQLVNNFNIGLGFTAFFLFFTCFFFHAFNGIRHLIWDHGYAFDLKTVYLSGYITIFLTSIFTISILFIFNL